jgi:hypothetical protein
MELKLLEIPPTSGDLQNSLDLSALEAEFPQIPLAELGGVAMSPEGAARPDITAPATRGGDQPSGEGLTDVHDVKSLSSEPGSAKHHIPGPGDSEGTVYESEFSRSTRDTVAETAPPAGTGAGGGDGPSGPTDPPEPPAGSPGEYPEPEPGDEGAGDFGWFDGADRPRPEPASEPLTGPAFVDERTLLRQMELLARAGSLISTLGGFAEGRQAAAEIRDAEETAAAAAADAARIASEPTPIADAALAAAMEAATPEVLEPVPPAEAPSGELPPAGAVAIDIAVDGRTYERVTLPQRKPDVSPEPHAGETPAETELRERQEQAALGPDWEAGPPDNILERVLAGLRGAKGQEKMDEKEDLGLLVIPEPTPDEIEAAGGDVMVARANKIAEVQEQRRRQREERGQ